MTGNEVLRLPTGEVITIVHAGDKTDGVVFEFEAVLPPRLSGPPAHWHRVEHETFMVTEGVLRMRVDRDTRNLRSGQTVTVVPGTVHSFSNPSDESVRVVTRESPAGQLEEQFRVMASAGRVPPLLRLAEVNARHDFSFFLAGMPAVPQRVLWQALAGLARFRRRFL